MKSKSKKIIGNILFLAGALLVLASFIILLKLKTEENNAKKAGEEGVNVILSHIRNEENNLKNNSADPNFGPEINADDSGDTALNTTEENVPGMPVYSANGISYIGIIEIPSVGICLPVTDGWTENTLRNATCRFYGNAIDHDLVIAGHNYRNGQFGDLKRVSLGDEVYFTQTDGVQFAYTVKETEILQPTDVIPMVESGFDLTLYTCTYGGKTRFTVRCVSAEGENQ